MGEKKKDRRPSPWRRRSQPAEESSRAKTACPASPFARAGLLSRRPSCPCEPKPSRWASGRPITSFGPKPTQTETLFPFPVLT
jgi:hypothetical protein